MSTLIQIPAQNAEFVAQFLQDLTKVDRFGIAQSILSDTHHTQLEAIALRLEKVETQRSAAEYLRKHYL